MGMILNLGVADIEKTEVFYDEILGLPLERFVPVAGHPPVLIMPVGDAVVLFRQLAALEALHPALFQNLHRHPLGVGCSLQLTVKDIDPIKRRLTRNQRPVLYELDDEEHGLRELWVHDLDGYLLVLDEEKEGS